MDKTDRESTRQAAPPPSGPRGARPGQAGGLPSEAPGRRLGSGFGREQAADGGRVGESRLRGP